MQPTRLLIVGTMAVAIGLYGGLRCDKPHPGKELSANAHTAALIATVHQLESDEQSEQDPWLARLGAASEQDVYDALYAGRSLADIAEANGASVQPVIDHQITELHEQLYQRLASGSITPSVYLSQLLELEEIVTRSVDTRMVTA